jgi:hypothetical protein
MRVQQDLIEMEHRKQVGEWIGRRMNPGDRIMLEPFGYIGYFSGARVMDWPGLVSREVTDVRKIRKNDKERWFPGVANALEPEWLILRPEDVTSMTEQPFLKKYALVQVFDVTDRLLKINHLPGRGWLNYDARFCVFRKFTEDASTPYQETFLRLTDAVARNMTWENGRGEGPGRQSSLIFKLPQPLFVTAVRVTFAYESAALAPNENPPPANFRLAWRVGQGSGRAYEPGYAWPQGTEPGEKTITFWINDTISEILIRPDTKPFNFRITDVTLLTPR